MLLVPCFGNKLKTIFYWDVAPYIWKENETIKGSFVYAINMMETKCKGPKSAYYRVNGGYKGFSEALSSVLDGKKIAHDVLKAHFPEAASHSCLEHNRKNAARRCKGGHKALIRRDLDWMAFLPHNLFHAAMAETLEGLSIFMALQALFRERSGI